MFFQERLGGLAGDPFGEVPEGRGYSHEEREQTRF